MHKANSFHITDGLFLECVDNVAKEFPEVETEDTLIDAVTAHLVRHPERFDVIVATNFYGDIISDLASKLSGSLGLASSVMASNEFSTNLPPLSGSTRIVYGGGSIHGNQTT